MGPQQGRGSGRSGDYSARQARPLDPDASSPGTVRSIVESTPLALCGFDHDGLVCLWNPACETLFGWPEAEVLGFEAKFIPDDRVDEFIDIGAVCSAARWSGVRDAAASKARKPAGRSGRRPAVRRRAGNAFNHPPRRMSITASIGIATSSEPGRDPGELLGDADAAMYRAKRDGRARYEFFEAESSDRAASGNQKRTVKQRSPRGPSA